MIEYPCSKINLGLNIVRKRSDGYHDLETVFYPIGLSDKITIEENKGFTTHDNPCEITIDGLDIEGNPQDNLIVRAYNKLANRFGSLPPVRVTLRKDIPTQAGLGGGSSDCAYTISMLNTMFKLGMNRADMMTMAAEMGADCAFFINPVPSFASGIGEKLSPVDLDLSSYRMAIVKPDVKISTREAFANVSPKQPQKCCRDIVRQPLETWKDELVNDFEQSVFPSYPCIADIKAELYRQGAVYASMSGSGSSLFGIFKDIPNDLKDVFKDCFVAIL